MAMAGMCCTLQASANVQLAPQDSVHHEPYVEKELMLQTIEPTYHNGVLVTSPWNGNWFVSLQGGASAFIGDQLAVLICLTGYSHHFPHQLASGLRHRLEQESDMGVGDLRTATL